METVWAWGDARLLTVVQESKTWRGGVKVNKENLKKWDREVHKAFRKIRPESYTNLTAGIDARVRKVIAKKGGRVGK